MVALPDDRVGQSNGGTRKDVEATMLDYVILACAIEHKICLEKLFRARRNKITPDCP